jgi:hypothetical protein
MKKTAPKTIRSHWMTPKIESFCQMLAEDQKLPLDMVYGIAIGLSDALGRELAGPDPLGPGGKLAR